MPNPQNTPSIPESITINGVTYLVKDTPELQQFIQSIAKVEKSKLYSQMENLRTQIQNLGNVEITPEQKTEFDVNALVEKLKDTFVTADSLKENLSNTIKEVVQPVLDATHRNEQNELNEYREKLIRENAATCIPELVKGNTKEELDAALKESIRLRGAYPAPGQNPNPQYNGDPNLQKQAEQQQFQAKPTPTPAATPAPQPQNPNPAPQAPAAPRFPAPDASQQGNSPRQMSMAEFAKQRDALKANLEAMYGGSSL